VHLSHGHFFYVTRSILRNVPYSSKNRSLRAFLPFFLFFFLLSAVISTKKGSFRPFLPCLCMQINFARHVASAFGVIQARQARRRVRIFELHVASFLSTASRDTFQNRPPHAFLSFSFSMERTRNDSHCLITSTEKRRTGIGMHPPISEMHHWIETRQSDDRISSRVSFSAERQREKKRKKKK